MCLATEKRKDFVNYLVADMEFRILYKLLDIIVYTVSYQTSVSIKAILVIESL